MGSRASKYAFFTVKMGLGGERKERNDRGDNRGDNRGDDRGDDRGGNRGTR